MHFVQSRAGFVGIVGRRPIRPVAMGAEAVLGKAITYRMQYEKYAPAKASSGICTERAVAIQNEGQKESSQLKMKSMIQVLYRQGKCNNGGNCRFSRSEGKRDIKLPMAELK